jgi:hypothetical protein
LRVTEHLLTACGKQKRVDGPAVNATATYVSHFWYPGLPRFGTKDVLKVSSNDNPKEFAERIGRHVHFLSRQQLPQLGNQRSVEGPELGGQVPLAIDY